MVQGANDIAGCIYESFRKNAAGVGTFLGAGVEGIVVQGKTDRFSIYGHLGQAIGRKINFCKVVGDLMPGVVCG